MIVTFSYPSTALYGGGVATLWSYANGLAARGHQIHLIHGPEHPGLISGPDDVDWFTFDPSITHHVALRLDDPSLPSADVIFQVGLPARMGQPAVLVQGYKLLGAVLERPLFRAPCPKLCVASWLTDIGVAWGSPPEQMLHSPLGIDLEHFNRAAGSDDRPIDVAMLHSVHPVKGTADGLAALAEVRRHRPDLRVVLFSVVPADDLPDWVEFRLAPDHATLAREVYGRTKVFLQPSWREGFGLTAIEAMACGAALVTTDNGGSRDYARPGTTAAVVAPHDIAALAAEVERLLGDEEARRGLAAAGAELAATFTWDRAAEILEAHLVRYLEDPAALQGEPGDAPLHLEDSW